MARRREWRVSKPYRELHRGRHRWRIIITSPAGDRRRVFAASEDEVDEAVKLAWKEIAGATTFSGAIDRYEEHLGEKGNKQSSITNTSSRLRGWFPQDCALAAFSEKDAQKCYDRRRTEVKPATHRAELAEAKTFARWLW
jgi:hypothetical protein